MKTSVGLTVFWYCLIVGCLWLSGKTVTLNKTDEFRLILQTPSVWTWCFALLTHLFTVSWCLLCAPHLTKSSIQFHFMIWSYSLWLPPCLTYIVWHFGFSVITLSPFVSPLKCISFYIFLPSNFIFMGSLMGNFQWFFFSFCKDYFTYKVIATETSQHIQCYSKG